MIPAKLIFKGSSEEVEGDLTSEGKVLVPGDDLKVVWYRSPKWNPKLGFERVIIGSHPERADVRLEGDGIGLEHVRMYFSKNDPTHIDFRPLEEDSTKVQGRWIDKLEIVRMKGGEDIEIGPWRFQFELDLERDQENELSKSNETTESS